MTKTEIALILVALTLVATLGKMALIEESLTCRNHGEISEIIWVDGNPLCKDCILEIVPIVIERETKTMNMDDKQKELDKTQEAIDFAQDKINKARKLNKFYATEPEAQNE